MPFEGHEGETVTRGLEHLEANCQQYYRYPLLLLCPKVKYILLCASCRARLPKSAVWRADLFCCVEQPY